MRYQIYNKSHRSGLFKNTKFILSIDLILHTFRKHLRVLFVFMTQKFKIFDQYFSAFKIIFYSVWAFALNFIIHFTVCIVLEHVER